MFWRSAERALEALILSQRTEIGDLRSALRSERESFALERKELLDKIIALSNPPAHRELHPRSPVERVVGDRPRRIHFPSSGTIPPAPPRLLPGGVEGEPEGETSS